MTDLAKMVVGSDGETMDVAMPARGIFLMAGGSLHCDVEASNGGEKVKGYLDISCLNGACIMLASDYDWYEIIDAAFRAVSFRQLKPGDDSVRYRWLTVVKQTVAGLPRYDVTLNTL